MPPKHKFAANNDNLNDGSDSNGLLEDYAPHAGGHRVHHIVNKSFSIAHDSRIHLTFTTVETPVSPAKNFRVTLNPEIPLMPAAPSTKPDWIEDFSEFDTEYGPRLQQGPRDLCSLVSILY